ncbi:MAG: hypothetical protein ABEJ92_04535 [Halobacteriales archaeon]
MVRREPGGPADLGQWLPYGLAGTGLVGGLVVWLFEPFPWPGANALVAGTMLAVAVGSTYFLVARGGGPGERGPDF